MSRPRVAQAPLKGILSEHEVTIGPDRWRVVRSPEGLYRELGRVRQLLHAEPLLPLGFSTGPSGAKWLWLDRGDGQYFRLRHPFGRRPHWLPWQQWAAFKPTLEAWLKQYPPGDWNPDTPK